MKRHDKLRLVFAVHLASAVGGIRAQCQHVLLRVQHGLYRLPRHRAGYSALLAALALTGCTTTRYVTVHCISHDQQLPAEPEKVGPKLTGDASKDVGILAGSAIRLRAWGQGLNQILEGCREPSK